MTLGRYIRVTTQAEGLHHWPAAPDGEDYLRQPHRHMFTIDLRMQVTHSDREVEINAFTRWLRDEVLPLLTTRNVVGPPDFGTQSCEQLAEKIVSQVRARYGSTRWIECEVLEDGFLGGGVRCSC